MLEVSGALDRIKAIGKKGKRKEGETKADQSRDLKSKDAPPEESLEMKDKDSLKMEDKDAPIDLNKLIDKVSIPTAI